MITVSSDMFNVCKLYTKCFINAKEIRISLEKPWPIIKGGHGRLSRSIPIAPDYERAALAKKVNQNLSADSITLDIDWVPEKIVAHVSWPEYGLETNVIESIVDILGLVKCKTTPQYSHSLKSRV